MTSRPRSSTPDAASPLAGVRVLDLSKVLAGPFCGRLLADLGADVVKVEPPSGDDARRFGPYVDGVSSYFRLFNRNKRGLALDLKSSADRERLLRLLGHADVLVENFRPGVMERLGLGVGELLERFPRVVVVSITGFGQTGPLSGLPAYDHVVQGMSGLLDATGPRGGPGTRTAVSLGDLVPGLYGALGALAALQQRERTGRGQHVDVAMFDSLLSLLESLAMRALHSEEPIERIGNDHALSAPLSTFATADAPIMIAIANDPLFDRFAAMLGRRDWSADPRFATDAHRGAHRDELRSEIEAITTASRSSELLVRLQEAGIPCGPVLDVRAALSHEQTLARAMVMDEPDGFRTLGSPLKLGGIDFPTPRPAPELGEHNADIPALAEAWTNRTGDGDGR